MIIRFLIAALLLAASPVRAIDIDVVETDAGFEAWLVEDHTIPFVALELVFEGGAALDRPGKEGAGYLMSGLIEEGAGDRDAQAFQTAREALAAEFRFDISADRMSVSAKMLSENREEAAALLGEALRAPRFDPDAVERVRGQVLAGLAADAVDPNAIAGRAFSAQVYGDHPYGRDREGTPQTVAGLTRDDLLQAHRDILVRDRVLISAVGDISAEELGVLVDGLLADLPLAERDLPGPADPQLAGGVSVAPFDTPQSVALFAQPGITQEDPDFFALYILNEILGGSGLQSRLMQAVREERGLTYGVYSYLVDREGAQLWQGSLASGNGTMAEAVEVVRAQWQLLASEGVTEDELTAAKTYLTGAYPLRFDGNGPIARILTGLQIQEKDPSYVNTRNDRINAVTLDQINRVARERLDPDRLTFVIAGQPEGLPE